MPVRFLLESFYRTIWLGVVSADLPDHFQSFFLLFNFSQSAKYEFFVVRKTNLARSSWATLFRLLKVCLEGFDKLTVKRLWL